MTGSWLGLGLGLGLVGDAVSGGVGRGWAGLGVKACRARRPMERRSHESRAVRARQRRVVEALDRGAWWRPSTGARGGGPRQGRVVEALGGGGLQGRVPRRLDSDAGLTAGDESCGVLQEEAAPLGVVACSSRPLEAA
jgi:hypothetical protein